MARSTNIYVVTDAVHRRITGAFTVKHEMVSMLYSQQLMFGNKWFSVTRVRDGEPVPPADITEEVRNLLSLKEHG